MWNVIVGELRDLRRGRLETVAENGRVSFQGSSKIAAYLRLKTGFSSLNNILFLNFVQYCSLVQA